MTFNNAPLMIGIESLTLSQSEKKSLSNPMVGGVILFSRNYDHQKQLKQLCDDIHAIKTPALLIGVDQEGGRVQRFREGFSSLRASGEIGQCYDENPKKALTLAYQTGYNMASELKACGVDLSFAPVLDIDNGSSVIGNRAFHRQPLVVATLAKSLMRGMHKGGLFAVGKHFPGHGTVKNDTHLDEAIDKRSLEKIEAQDLIPFVQLIRAGIDGIMASHVIYPKIDKASVGFSRIWLQDILRKKWHFRGMIFSDDLGMLASKHQGDIDSLIEKARQAGCDKILLCNHFADIKHVTRPSLHE